MNKVSELINNFATFSSDSDQVINKFLRSLGLCSLILPIQNTINHVIISKKNLDRLKHVLNSQLSVVIYIIKTLN